MVPQWLRRDTISETPDGDVPPEVVWLRIMGLITLGAFIFFAFASHPHAGLSGRGLPILVLTMAWAGSILYALPLHRMATRRRLAWLVFSAAVSVTLYGLQPDGFWVASPYIVAATCAMRLASRESVVMFGADLVATVVVGSSVGHTDQAFGIITGVIPFYLFMRLMRRTREAHDVTKELVRELEASRAAEAESAAENERARVAREMHDVLAHSLSALALQLESTRLLAKDRGVDPEVLDAVERAHGLAASGLEEARRAIGALRGDELPPLSALVEAFRESTGIPCSLIEDGTSVLAAQARLTLYRTAQEALTNVRKHAPDADRVEVTVLHGISSTLTIADHGRVPVAVGAGSGGYGLTGMRERAALLGGTLSAKPTADGFCVELVLPS